MTNVLTKRNGIGKEANYSESAKNSASGITLIALVITIIVLLILAGVAIAMLSGQNGVLNRATEAKLTNTVGAFDEQIKLAQMSAKTSISSKTATKSGYMATKNETIGEIAQEVAKGLGVTAKRGGEGGNINTEGYTVGYYLDTQGNESTNGKGYIVIWYTNNGLRSTMKDRAEAISKTHLVDVAEANTSVNQAVIVAVIEVENYTCNLSSNTGLTSTTDGGIDVGKGTFEATSLNGKLGFASEETGGGSGDDTPVVPTETSAINYGTGKTKDDVVQGDTITITFGKGASAYTEQFMMLTKANNRIIVAMPYYNITQSTTDPRQSSNTSETGTLAFSGSSFWTKAGANIEPMSKSNIQGYIDAYSKKLKLATGGTESGGIVTGGKVSATVGRCRASGIANIGGFSGRYNLRNPSGVGNFWVGSSSSSFAPNVHYVDNYGKFGEECYNWSNICGVRPVILIDIS